VALGVQEPSELIRRTIISRKTIRQMYLLRGLYMDRLLSLCQLQVQGQLDDDTLDAALGSSLVRCQLLAGTMEPVQLGGEERAGFHKFTDAPLPPEVGGRLPVFFVKGPAVGEELPLPPVWIPLIAGAGYHQFVSYAEVVHLGRVSLFGYLSVPLGEDKL